MRLMLSLGTDGGIGISLALVAVISCKVPGYKSLRLRKKDSFIHPGSAKKFSTCNAKD